MRIYMKRTCANFCSRRVAVPTSTTASLGPAQLQHARNCEALAQLLAMLGQSRLANNVNQLAKAANTGSLPVTPETEEALLTAVQEVTRMRQLLIEALDLDARL